LGERRYDYKRGGITFQPSKRGAERHSAPLFRFLPYPPGSAITTMNYGSVRAGTVSRLAAPDGRLSPLLHSALGLTAAQAGTEPCLFVETSKTSRSSHPKGAGVERSTCKVGPRSWPWNVSSLKGRRQNIAGNNAKNPECARALWGITRNLKVWSKSSMRRRRDIFRAGFPAPTRPSTYSRRDARHAGRSDRSWSLYTGDGAGNHFIKPALAR
jgi:hypothetical protein